MNAPVRDVRAVITAERARELLAYDPDTGLLTWRVPRPGTRAGALAGTCADGYLQVQLDGLFYRAHRVIWLLQTGSWPEHQIDHINGVRDDNRWCNLREATPLQNARNRALTGTGNSGRLGVSWDRTRGKWSAYIGVDNRNLNLGCFEAKEDAVEARCAAERHYFGEFARQVSR